MQNEFLDWTASNERKISQVIVVEGRDDTANLKRYFDVETYETRGSAINEQDIARIQRPMSFMESLSLQTQILMGSGFVA